MGKTYRVIANSYIASPHFLLYGDVHFEINEEVLTRISISSEVEWKKIQMDNLKKVFKELNYFDIEVNNEKHNVILTEFSNFEASFYLLEQRIKYEQHE